MYCRYVFPSFFLLFWYTCTGSSLCCMESKAKETNAHYARRVSFVCSGCNVAKCKCSNNVILFSRWKLTDRHGFHPFSLATTVSSRQIMTLFVLLNVNPGKAVLGAYVKCAPTESVTLNLWVYVMINGIAYVLGKGVLGLLQHTTLPILFHRPPPFRPAPAWCSLAYEH